jgi:hypothetical protein
MAIKNPARRSRRLLVMTELRIAGSMNMHNNETISRYPSGKSVFRSVIRNIDFSATSLRDASVLDLLSCGYENRTEWSPARMTLLALRCTFMQSRLCDVLAVRPSEGVTRGRAGRKRHPTSNRSRGQQYDNGVLLSRRDSD